MEHLHEFASFEPNVRALRRPRRLNAADMTIRIVLVALFTCLLASGAAAIEAGPRLPALLSLAVSGFPAAARAGETVSLDLEVSAPAFPAGSVAVELRGAAFAPEPAPPAFALPAGGSRKVKLSARAARKGTHALTARVTCEFPAEALARFVDDPKRAPDERATLRDRVAALAARGRPAFSRSVTVDVR